MSTNHLWLAFQLLRFIAISDSRQGEAPFWSMFLLMLRASSAMGSTPLAFCPQGRQISPVPVSGPRKILERTCEPCEPRVGPTTSFSIGDVRS